MKSWQKTKQNRSKGHQRVYNILCKLFPLYTICEEYPVPGAPRLKIDLFVKELNLAIEVDSRLHQRYTSHFHKTLEKFADSQMRDEFKQNRCCDEGLIFIAIDPEKKSNDSIKQLIIEALE